MVRNCESRDKVGFCDIRRPCARACETLSFPVHHREFSSQSYALVLYSPLLTYQEVRPKGLFDMPKRHAEMGNHIGIEVLLPSVLD